MALLSAIRHQSINSLKIILSAAGKEGYLKEWRSRESLALEMLEAAAEIKSKEAWDVVQEWNARPDTAYRPYDWQIIKIIVRLKFDPALRDMFDRDGVNKGSLFADALGAASGQSTEHIKFALQYVVDSHAAQKALSSALDRAAADGSKERVDLFLAKGAAIDHDNGEALWQAIYNSRFEMVDHLLSKGADLAAYGHLLVTRLREKNPQLPAIDYLDRLYQKAVEQKEKRRLQEERFSLAGPETLAETLPLPSGGTLTLLFNFATRQQIIMVQEKSLSKELSSFQVINFADIENHDAIERAAQKLIELGGDAKAVTASRRGKSTFPKN
jgi:hypothetical protein